MDRQQSGWRPSDTLEPRVRNGASTTELVDDLDAVRTTLAAGQRGVLRLLAELDRRQVWVTEGCRDMANWVCQRFDIAWFRAKRWVAASYALESLPRLAEALSSGALGLDKVVELARFATPDDEAKLIRWASKVALGTLKNRADVATRAVEDSPADTIRARFLHHFVTDDGRAYGLSGYLPADQGAIVVKAIDRLAGSVPRSPEDLLGIHASEADTIEQRRADALVGLCSAALADDPDPDRATVVVHASLDALMAGTEGAEIEDGPAIHPAIARRLSCDCRLQLAIHDRDGNAVGIGRADRNVPRWLFRALKRRDRTCTFPGCQSRAYLQAHHIVYWENWGPTDLCNLVLVCPIHHKLVHEFGWGVRLGSIPGTADWFRPDKAAYEPGRSPPRRAALV